VKLSKRPARCDCRARRSPSPQLLCCRDVRHLTAPETACSPGLRERGREGWAPGDGEALSILVVRAPLREPADS